MTKSNPRITRNTGRSLANLLRLHRPCLPWRRCPLLRLSDLSSSPFAHHRYLARLRRDAVLLAAQQRATASLAGLVLGDIDFQQYKALHESNPNGPIFVEGAFEDPEFIEVTDRFFKSPAARLLFAYLRDLDDGVSPNSNEFNSDAL